MKRTFTSVLGFMLLFGLELLAQDSSGSLFSFCNQESPPLGFATCYNDISDSDSNVFCGCCNKAETPKDRQLRSIRQDRNKARSCADTCLYHYGLGSRVDYGCCNFVSSDGALVCSSCCNIVSANNASACGFSICNILSSDSVCTFCSCCSEAQGEQAGVYFSYNSVAVGNRAEVWCSCSATARGDDSLVFGSACCQALGADQAILCCSLIGDFAPRGLELEEGYRKCRRILRTIDTVGHVSCDQPSRQEMLDSSKAE